MCDHVAKGKQQKPQSGINWPVCMQSEFQQNFIQFVLICIPASWTGVLVVCLGWSWRYFTPYIHHFNVQTQINIPPSIMPCILLRNTKSPGCLFLLPAHNLQVCLRTDHLSVCWILSLSFELFLCVYYNVALNIWRCIPDLLFSWDANLNKTLEYDSVFWGDLFRKNSRNTYDLEIREIS